MAINFFVANIAVVKMGGRYPAPFAAKATTAPGGGRCSRLIQKAMGWFRDPISSASSQRKDAHLASRREPLASVGHQLRFDAQNTSYELAQTHSCVGTCGIVLNYPTGYEVGIIPALVRPGLVALLHFSPWNPARHTTRAGFCIRVRVTCGRGVDQMARQYAVNVCRDEPNALRDLLGEIAKEGGRVISVNWQPARSVVGPGEPKEQNSGYVVVSETDTETE